MPEKIGKNRFLGSQPWKPGNHHQRHFAGCRILCQGNSGLAIATGPNPAFVAIPSVARPPDCRGHPIVGAGAARPSPPLLLHSTWEDYDSCIEQTVPSGTSVNFSLKRNFCLKLKTQKAFNFINSFL